MAFQVPDSNPGIWRNSPLPVAWESGEWSNLLLEWIIPSDNFSQELLLRTAVSIEYLAELFVM
jgi:hypothetical protein